MAHIVRTDPFFELISPQDQANQLDQQNPGDFKEFGPEYPLPAANLLPFTQILEDEHNITLQAKIPGITREDVNIAVEGNVLILTAERRVKKEEKDGNAQRTERRSGRFVRSFTLPPNVDCQSLYAILKNGVLNITLPKRDGIHS